MPNVDLDVCSIYELKLFEISSLYSDEISYYGITEEELIEMIGIFDIDQLLTNDINDSILLIITHLHG
jgi:hypothetical protein